MKKILNFLFFIPLFLFTEGKAQLDTLNYLKQFEVNKVNYIGQPFSKLLQDMTQIQPKTVWNKPPWRNKNIILDTQFSFSTMNSSFKNAITLLIEWENSIPRSQIKNLEQLNHFYFTNDEKSFYGNKIVKDIMVFR